ncbi:MAG: FAD-dependent oxidoreductase [Ruminococcus sp.]|jgi:NADPH-dependent 2,4-dienoyl-CoA reductase/sulfur reductase-like enzyme/rhodanese-related sulfurtransferase
MKVLVIGGVAAGTKVAAKLKRLDRSAEVRILTMSKEISYAGCGLPYYVGDVIHDRGELVVNTPEKYMALTGAQVETEVEVTSLDRGAKRVTATDHKTGEEKIYDYDKLVIAVGASPIVPPVEGTNLKNVFVMRTPDDAAALRDAVETGEIKRAVVAGAGFIGMEVAENLHARGVRTTVIDMAPQIMPPFDPEMAEYAENHLADEGIMCFPNTSLEAVLGTEKVEKVKTSRKAYKADALILALGIRANTAFLADTGIELMTNRTVKVDKNLRTNDPDIYAVGDCAMVTNRLTGQPAWSPMGSSANIEGRMLAQELAGAEREYPGALGTGICKLPGLNCGRTGLGEKAAKEAGFDPVSVITVVDDKAHYYPGADSFIVKMIGDRNSRKLLGMQCMGPGAVDKMVDIAVMAISLGADLNGMEYLDFAYAPPFSTAIHPFAHTLNVLLNKMDGEIDSVTPVEYKEGKVNGYTVLDVSISPTLEDKEYVNFTAIDGELQGHPRDEKLLLVCSKGKRAYLTQNRLKYYGYVNTKVLEGGTIFNGKEINTEQ